MAPSRRRGQQHRPNSLHEAAGAPGSALMPSESPALPVTGAYSLRNPRDLSTAPSTLLNWSASFLSSTWDPAFLTPWLCSSQSSLWLDLFFRGPSTTGTRDVLSPFHVGSLGPAGPSTPQHRLLPLCTKSHPLGLTLLRSATQPALRHRAWTAHHQSHRLTASYPSGSPHGDPLLHPANSRPAS